MKKDMVIGNVNVKTLAKEFGTPLYVYDIQQVKEKIRTFEEEFKSALFQTEILYASKAFCIKAMVELIAETSFGIDVVSGGELYTALQAGMSPDRIHFHGNNKSKEEIQFALKSKVGTFIVDNLQEAQYLLEVTKNMDYNLKCLLRVNPGVEAHTHKYIVTANVDSKFGISIQKRDEVIETIRTLQSAKNITFMGLHAHIGSQIFEKQAFVAEIEVMCQFISSLEQDGILCPTLDLGGGFAATYTSEDSPIPIKEVCQIIIHTCNEQKEKYHLSLNQLMIEPGRSIVAEAGYTLYTVGFSKETPHKKYVFIDGGMADNIRPALYEAKYSCDIANRMDEEKTEVVTIAGKCCESGDVIAKDVLLQHAQENDLLVTYTTGAYGFSMASNYNKICRPPVIFVEDGKYKEVVKRQTYEDLLKDEL